MRTALFLMVFSIVLLILFAVFCFLMSIVNPKVLVIDGSDKDLKSQRKNDGDDLDLFSDTVVTNNDLSFGLEKAKMGDVKDLTPRTVLFYDKLDRYGSVANGSLTSQNASVDDPFRRRQPKVLTLSGNNITEAKTTPSKENQIKRRSVGELEGFNRELQGTSGVILKIIDEMGHSKVHINLTPVQSRKILRSYSKIKGDEYVANKNIKYTVIKIMPNNTIILDDVDNSLVSVDIIKDDGLEFGIKNSSIIKILRRADLFIHKWQNLTNNIIGNDEDDFIAVDKLNITGNESDTKVSPLNVDIDRETTPLQYTMTTTHAENSTNPSNANVTQISNENYLQFNEHVAMLGEGEGLNTGTNNSQLQSK